MTTITIKSTMHLSIGDLQSLAKKCDRKDDKALIEVIYERQKQIGIKKYSRNMK
jgi:hypothetical protein